MQKKKKRRQYVGIMKVKFTENSYWIRICEKCTFGEPHAHDAHTIQTQAKEYECISFFSFFLPTHSRTRLTFEPLPFKCIVESI